MWKVRKVTGTKYIFYEYLESAQIHAFDKSVLNELSALKLFEPTGGFEILQTYHI